MVDHRVEDLLAEIERLRTQLAIQFGMHPGGDLAKTVQAKVEQFKMEQDKAWTKHLLEREELKAEIERLRAQAPDNLPRNEREWWIALRDQNHEIERLRALVIEQQERIIEIVAETERLKVERHTVKRMLRDLLDRHGYSGWDAARSPTSSSTTT